MSEQQNLSAAEIEARARDNGISVTELCIRSGVARTTFYRWRRGHDIFHGAYLRLVEAAMGGNDVPS